MKTIGLIGGMSWESTVTYYQTINRTVKETLGGLHSARCVLWSVDFQEIEERQTRGDWDGAAGILAEAAQNLERAGADFIVICTNTMHKVAEQIREAVAIPLLHIADVTAEVLLEKGIRQAGLLGTKYTMEQDFYKERLFAKGIEAMVPGADDRERMNHIIFRELCLGVVEPESRAFVLRLVDSMASAGAGGVILGCTEIGLLIGQEDTDCPLFDTALIHAREAALRALAGVTPG